MPDVSIEHDGAVATVRIDRPQVRNAIARSTIAELETALSRVEEGRSAVLVLRGAGERAFVSGGDLKELSAIRSMDSAVDMALRMRRLLDRISTMAIPTIAALNGHALGGGAEIAVACDFRIAADDVMIAFNQSQLAIMPAWGGVERLVDLVGRSRALQLLLTGDRLRAVEAKRVGLVNLTPTRDEFDRAVSAFAASISALPPTVSRSIKASVNEASPNHHPALEQAAVQAFAELWVADDHWVAVEEVERARRARAVPNGGGPGT
ncbi:MAG: enoyl-CoA hydratase/isomerase family protein [Nocardioidaceae bacterium]